MSDQNSHDEMPSDYAGRLKGGVRGKYFEVATGNRLPIELDPDLKELFPDSKAVNEGLRELIGFKRTAKGS